MGVLCNTERRGKRIARRRGEISRGTQTSLRQEMGKLVLVPVGRGDPCYDPLARFDLLAINDYIDRRNSTHLGDWW